MGIAMRITVVKFNKHINKKGFTLIELMVAVVILMISMTAILHSIIQYQRINLENTMRNESMRIVEAQLEQLRSQQFAQLVPGGPYTPGSQPVRTIRNVSVAYTVNWTIESISLVSVAVRVNATWSYRGVNHRHNASTIISTDA